MKNYNKQDIKKGDHVYLYTEGASLIVDDVIDDYFWAIDNDGKEYEIPISSPVYDIVKKAKQ